MNMPPLAYMRRFPALNADALKPAFDNPDVWSGIKPGLMSLCSPDPQAYRLPETGANTLHVGLPTNFKAAPFEDPAHTALLRELEADIDALRVDGKDVPVKLRVFDSLFVPFAKWSMLLTGNYRCILPDGVRSIRDAVHSDIAVSEKIYTQIEAIVRALGAGEDDQVPFAKYASAANGLLKPSSAARAVDSGAEAIERVDLLVKLIADQLGMPIPELAETVTTVDTRLAANRRAVA